jgi:tyrosinase
MLIIPQEELYKHVQHFADTAPPDQASRYEAAANSFRMPYWDWARGEDTIPEFFTTQRIDVIRPNGTHESLWNPLYSYYFHPVTSDVFDSKVQDSRNMTIEES